MKTFQHIQVGDIIKMQQDGKEHQVTVDQIFESRQKPGLKTYRAFKFREQGMRVGAILVESTASEYIATPDKSVTFYL